MEAMESATVSEKEEIRLFLFGKTGSGKSETGNTILGKKMFQTSPLLCSKAKTSTLKRNLRKGSMIEVLDTVGVFDTDKTMIETLTAVVKAVVSMHPGPHAILYVLKIERFTNEVMDTYNIFKSYFDDAVSNYTIIVLTHGDALERDRLTLDDVMKDAPEAFRRLCAEVKNRVVIFNNIAENKDHQVNNLLQVVREMMLENQNIPYSSSKYAYAGYLVDKIIDLGMMTTAIATVNNILKSPYHKCDRVNSTLDVISSLHHNDEDLEAKVRIQMIDERERKLREKEELLKRQQEMNEQEKLLNIGQKELLQREEEMLKRWMQEMKEREEKERTLKEREDKMNRQEREEEIKRKEREEEKNRKEREDEKKRKEREEREKEKRRKEREKEKREEENRRDYRRRFKDGSEEEDSIFCMVVKQLVHYLLLIAKIVF